ncbi:C45 family autoproteolytic acyltransferase/hydolase [Frigoriglobus tundricola]|uniref:Uncharacterized protein n=1 Tax=Frigoriglobus tundricola TaxID=2774151 RepID=A0A6M5YXI3_9BACT|nr:C45 family autoproteolytic acyltransferase/hydolase [Frigoriglobus tundricola]QJW97662.1 hypothetical protein FTUN_5239 [Frigoriglobus tundricola]
MLRRSLTGLVAFFVIAAAARAGEPFRPDPLSVRREGAGFRYPQAGWTVLHIEGKPYERGYQHGRLLAKEIAGHIRTLSVMQSQKAPADAWNMTRTLVGATSLRKFDREFLEEMKGIADGAAAGGATVDGRPIDLTDVAGINLAAIEFEFLDAALRATPTGLEGTQFPKPAPAGPKPEQPHHCSAFAATGPATADGKIVFGHITMWALYPAAQFNVWLDVKPEKGHRVVMQTFPGGIFSGLDYYINSAGLMLTETTIRQTRFNADGTPLANRCRRAMQYADTIDGLIKELSTGNNGLYTNEWLIGDANTNEIAMFELGTTAERLWRSSKKEWVLPGTEGFYWGCNNTKDRKVQLDTVASVLGRPEDVSWRPSDRDKAWLGLFRDRRGKVGVEFGKFAFSAAPLAKLSSLDAKITTSDMAKKLASHALFGPPYGRVWAPKVTDRDRYPEIRALVPNDWTVIGPIEPGKADRVAVDLSDPPASPPPSNRTVPAWTGTLLPKTDADLWLTAGSAAYEPVAALDSGEKSTARTEAVELALFRFRSGYLAARANQPDWKRTGGAPPAPLDVELDRDRWHREQVGYGALTLHELRGFVGPAQFVEAMDAFSRARAGREVSATEFAEDLAKRTGKDVVGWLAKWAADPRIEGPAFAVNTWLQAPESALIVYGTRADAAANREAAAALRDGVLNGGWNVAIPAKADTEVTDSDMKGRHVLLVGRPPTNAVAARHAAAFPVTFGSASVRVQDRYYAHEGTAVVAAGTNPTDPRFSVVLIAGLSADATYRAAGRSAQQVSGEVCVLPAGGAAKPTVVTRPKPPVATKASAER